MKEVIDFIGTSDLSVSETMQRIDMNTYGILFITDETGVILGAITDGDIRRFLLYGGKMDSNVMQAANKNPKTARSDSEAENLYNQKDYSLIPIIDDKQRIIGIYKGEGKEIRQKELLHIPVVINAGGRGSRLDPFTRVLPKPLIPVGEMPIIEHIMHEFESYECTGFSIIVNYKKELLKTYFQENSKKYDITWYDEAMPLGTAGGLSLLKGKMESTFFFANCDVLLKANYGEIIRFHKDNRNAITMVCAYKNMNLPYGVVEIGEGGLVEKIKEKPLMSFLTNTGIYVVEPEVIEDLEPDQPVDFPDIIKMEMDQGKKVAAFPVSENDWMDMGQMPELEKMRVRLYGD